STSNGRRSRLPSGEIPKPAAKSGRADLKIRLFETPLPDRSNHLHPAIDSRQSPSPSSFPIDSDELNDDGFQNYDSVPFISQSNDQRQL
ncbi:hypothetical protein ACLOJK_014798, partial [Asimina triloba]